MPPSILAGPTTTWLSGSVDACLRERGAVAAQAAAHDALEIEVRARRSAVDADDEDLAMAEGEQMLGGHRAPPSSSTSTTACSGNAVESTSTIGSPARRICSTSG